MEKKENQRITLTKRLVQESLLELLKHKNLYKISIRELCTQAGINRSTFYHHYGSQFDVLSEMAQAYLVSIERMIDAADVRDTQSVFQRVELVLQHILDHLQLSKMLIHYHVDETFTERLFSLPKIGEMLDDALSDMPHQETKEAVTAFAIHGSYKLLQDWINDENRVSAADETQLILTLAGRVCDWR